MSEESGNALVGKRLLSHISTVGLKRFKMADSLHAAASVTPAVSTDCDAVLLVLLPDLTGGPCSRLRTDVRRNFVLRTKDQNQEEGKVALRQY